MNTKLKVYEFIMSYGFARDEREKKIYTVQAKRENVQGGKKRRRGVG